MTQVYRFKDHPLSFTVYYGIVSQKKRGKTMLLPLLLPLFLPLAALAEGSPDFDFSSNKPRQPHWKQCLLPEKEPSSSDKARFREEIHLQLTSLVQTQTDQCSNDGFRPDCKELAKTLKPLWRNMRFHLALANIDKLDDSLMPVWDFFLKHEPSHLESIPSPGQEEAKRIRKIWKKEVLNQLDFSQELPSNKRRAKRLKRKILGSPQARSLKEDSRKRYFQILTSIPLLGYLPSENPSSGEVHSELKKIRQRLEEIKDSELDIFSLAPLVEEILQEKSEYCPAAEALAAEQSQDRMLGTGILVGVSIASAIPCFFTGPIGLSICLMGGVSLGSYGIWQSLDELNMSRRLTLLGSEYVSLSELNENENAVLVEKALFPLAFWGTTAVPMRAAGELFSPFSRGLKIESILGRKLTLDQKKAIDQAHIVGKGEQGKDPSLPAHLNNYNESQLRQKSAILKRAGFDKKEREQLIRRGIVGEEATEVLKNNHPAFNAVSNNDQHALESSLKNGVDPDLTDEYGETLLLAAISKRNINAIRLLLDNGADPNIPNKIGQSPLDIAILKLSDNAIIQLLDSRGGIRLFF